MGEARLHVVSGTAQAGSSLRNPAGVGIALRAVSRHRPVTLAGGTDWRAVNAADHGVAAVAAKGASVVYQCVNTPYAQSPERFPLLQRACWLLPSVPARCRW